MKRRLVSCNPLCILCVHFASSAVQFTAKNAEDSQKLQSTITSKTQSLVSLPVSKEQILAKMQEFDAILQAAVNVRTELWSMIATLPENMPIADIEIPLTFYDNGYIITWGNDSEHFSPSTFRLLLQLWFAPNRILSKEDVRETVNEDEDASDGAIRHVLCKARLEMEKVEFPYEIETLRKGKGYKMNVRDNVPNLRNG